MLASLIYEKKIEPPVHVLQGQIVDSNNELYVALALARLKQEFIYQYNVFDMSRLAGSIIVDFFVFTVPVYTFLFVDGEYWHSTSFQREKDRLQREKLRAKYHYNIVAVYGSETTTEDTAYNIIKQRLQL